MKRVFIIHGWSGKPDEHWLTWFKEKMNERGYEVFAPMMPDTDTPKIDTWVNHLSKVVSKVDSETYFVGHSIGCQAILRYLETVNTPVGGAVFVAGWFDLKRMESEEVGEVATPWINIPIDLNKVKSVLPRSTLIISDNDPYDAFEYNKQKFAELGSKIVVVNNAGHFTADDGFTQLPEVLAEFE